MENAPRSDAGPRSDARGAQGSRFRRITILFLAMGLMAVAGCATGGQARVAPAEPKLAAAPTTAAELLPPVPTGPSVVHFTDGREGFVLTQRSGMDARSRGDFDQASALIRDGKCDQAIQLLEKIIAQWPEMTAPRINVAIAYRQVNKPEQAEEHLKKALESIPGHPVASNEYGLLLRKAGRFTESRQVYEKSLALFPEYYPVHKNLAILCDLYLKDATCAVEHYQIYGKAVPKDPQVKLWLADLQTRSGPQVASLKASAGGSPLSE